MESEDEFHHALEYQPPKNQRSSSYIPTPKSIVHSRAIINVKNEHDQKCFKWAITSAVFPDRIASQNQSKKMREDLEKLDWTSVNFPAWLEDFDTFEKNNPYAINVLMINPIDNKTYCLRCSKKYDCQLIYLLLLRNEEGKEHYCWIKDISKLMTRQISKHHGRREYCSRCLKSFNSEKKLDRHLGYCGIIWRHEAAKVECGTCSKECLHSWWRSSCRDCKKEREMKKRGKFYMYDDVCKHL